MPGPTSLVMAGVIAIVTPLAFGGYLSEPASRALIDGIQVLAVGAACWMTARVARIAALSHAQRRAFTLLAASLLALLIADAGWAWVDVVRGEDPSRSWINWLYLPFYPLMLAGVLAFPRIFRSAPDRMRFMLDALIFALGAGLLLWDRIAGPHLPAMPDSDAVALFVLFGQPLLDGVAALAVAVLLLRLPTDSSRQPMLWLALALTLNLAGNLVLAALAAHQDYSTGGIADVLWIASRWCFVAAAEAQLRVHRAPCSAIEEGAATPSFQVLPYLGVMIGYATVMADARADGVSSANLGGAFVLTLLLLLRQAIDRREADSLLSDRARRAGDTRLAALVEHASEAILVLDAQRCISYASPAAARLLGAEAAELRGEAFTRFLHPHESLAAATLLADGDPPGPTRQAMLRLRRGTGWIWTDCAITDLLARADVHGIVLNVRDVSAHRELEDQLRHQSFHDPLTGLINRLLFGERISEALTERHPDGSAMAVMFVDLDHFKVINDSLGHGSGDAVLGQAAARLELAVRDRDVLARLGGDEFAVLLQDLRDHNDIVEAARRVMEAFRAPFRIDGREIAISVSLGIAWAADDDTVDVLLRNADLALNEAKARGRDRFHVFQPDLHATVLRKLQLHGDLRELLERDRFLLAYQPILRCDDLQVVGIEALLRWPDDANVDASTSDAVSAAEESGLIVSIGRWVLERALAELGQLQERHGLGGDLRLTVNLSARQLHDPELPQLLEAMLARHRIPASRLVLELTETALADHPGAALQALLRLKALGLRLAIDDFGTGYSSLAQLARFPFDLLKVAKPFVDLITHEADADGARLARAVLAMGESLRLQTIAEGVEQSHQLTLLREAGCDLVQGFLLARPLPLPALADWLRQRPARRPFPE